MTLSMPASLKPKKLLIVTSSGGGGLIQTANAKEQEERELDPTVEIIRIDILEDWMGKKFGRFCSWSWNQAQQNGNVNALRFLSSCQSLFDYVFWPYFFLRALIVVFKEEIDRVIDTQIFAMSAFVKALRIYNRLRGKKILIQKVLVDLPTNSAGHFFRPIKRLNPKDRRAMLQVTSIAPLLEEGQTAEEFWQKHCGLSEKEIHYREGCVRKAFRKYRHRKRDENPISVTIRYKSKEELELIEKCLQRNALKAELKHGEIHFSIPAKDRVGTILLGSQPAKEATFNYVKKFLQAVKEAGESGQTSHLFVFCSEHASNQKTLFREVAEYVFQEGKDLSNFSVIPFSFQSEETIASLFFRSDLTCTRSGGQTAMELMCVCSGEILVHSEAKKNSSNKDEGLTLQELLSGILRWEAASALYLKKVCNGKIITPETISPSYKRLVSRNLSAN
ncbi:MAG: hypothetical protein FJZ64_01385 [Chlamydiae bacterium]|nr:hypothetical protein [Chlamydiota bacterium]